MTDSQALPMSDLNIAELAEDDVSAGEPMSTSVLPFSFAKANEVLVEWIGDACFLLHAESMRLEVLLEVRRFLGVGFKLKAIDIETFQRKLTLAYQRTQSEAAQMAEDIGADVDLARLVDEIPDLGDLMDAEDDAPIIRLINAVLSQAVKDQASDIHIETFEDRLR